MNTLIKPDKVIFLGAGASCADGAPIQSELFREYFRYYQSLPERRTHHTWEYELDTFFIEFFGIDVRDTNSIDKANFPTFEEVLGIIELAESQKESFKDWGTSHIVDAQQKPRLQHMHDVLILLITEILDHKLKGQDIHHPGLVDSLKKIDWLSSTSFISLNYDILMDNALLSAREKCKLDLDYAVDFINFGAEWAKPNPAHSIKLLKLHGSLNWLYCPTCRMLKITPKEKGICRLKWHPEDCLCDKCETLSIPIVIPPTYFKALENMYLRQIWHAAEQVLNACDKLVFCGYSFPDADVHIRYLLKRVEVNRQATPEVFIVNEHEGKKDVAREMEKERYLRFFRDKRKVHWTKLSFEDFSKNPASVEDQSQWA